MADTDKRLASLLLDWYARNGRALPWRQKKSDPYAIWVSEIMLQQTRVEVVIPYFQRWMARFPTISALAEASQQDVLALWEGLGYYGRARNLHRAARIVMTEYGGQLAGDPASLRRLPGIGRYTSGAIASIAFGYDVPALDGNVRRVLARLFDVQEPLGSPSAEKQLSALAGDHLPSGRAGDYNQALMDLGAMVCTPRAPRCDVCPVENLCRARALGVQELRPVRPGRLPIPHYQVAAAVIQRNGKVLITRRPEHGLLGGLWEFPGGKLEPGESPETGLRREIMEELGVDIDVREPLGSYRHAYTHYRVTLQAFRCALVKGTPVPLQVDDLSWVRFAELADYPMGKLDRMIAERLQATR